MRHFVDIFAPSVNLDSRGQARGAPAVVMQDVPCEIETLAGREAEIARQLVPTASLRVKMFGPILGLDTRCYMKEHPITAASKPIHVGHVNDVHRNGRELHLLCTEEV